jgi:hypothetical protein
MAVGCFDPPTFLHSSAALSSIWSNNDVDDQSNSDDSTTSFRRQVSNNDLFFGNTFNSNSNVSSTTATTMRSSNANDFNSSTTTNGFGAIGQPFNSSSTGCINNSKIRSCWSPINHHEGFSSWSSVNNWINGAEMSNNAEERADSTRSGSDSLTSSLLQNSPVRNPWSNDDSPPVFPETIKKPTKSLSSVYDAYNTDNEYSLFQDFVKLNIDDACNPTSFGAPSNTSNGSTKSSTGHLNSFAQSHNSAPSPPSFIEQKQQQNYYQPQQQHFGVSSNNNNNSYKNAATFMKKNHTFCSVASDSKIYENANYWNNNMYGGHHHQGSEKDLYQRQVYFN